MICKGLTVVVLSFYEPSLVSLVCTGRYHQHVSWAQRGVAGPMVCGNGGCHLLCHQSCFMWGRNWVIRSCTSGIASEVGFPRMTGPPNLEIWHEFFPDFHPDLGQSWIILGVWNHQTTNFNQLQPTSTNFNQLQPTSTNFNQHTEFFSEVTARSLVGHCPSPVIPTGWGRPPRPKFRQQIEGGVGWLPCILLFRPQRLCGAPVITGSGSLDMDVAGNCDLFSQVGWAVCYAAILCYTAKLTALYCYTRRWEFLSWFLDVAPLAPLFQCWLGDLAPPGAIQTPACRCSAWNSGGQSQVLGRLR